MSGLFEEFYYFAQHYSWIKEERRAKEIFMKVLEKFAAKNISIVDVKQVRNFLQKEIFTISNSVNEASVDFEIYNRYNFIVSDLIKRKLVVSQVTRTSTTTKTTASPVPIVQHVTRRPIKNYLKDTTKKKITKRPHSWKPGKTPNSPHQSEAIQKPQIPHFYPQSSSWLQEKLLASLAPGHNEFSGATHSIEQSSIIDSGILL